MTAMNALLAAIHQTLSSDPAVMALVGTDGIRDRLLPRPQLPCILFGTTETRDYSTASEPGEEHFVTLEIWSDGEGRREAHELARAVKAALHDAALAVEGASLVSLMMIGSRTRREPKTKLTLAELRFRAVTE